MIFVRISPFWTTGYLKFHFIQFVFILNNLSFYFQRFSSPEGRRFRTRSDIRAFLEDKTDIKYSDAIFDFSLSKRSRRSVTHSETPRKVAAEVKPAPPVEAPAAQVKEEQVEGIVVFAF